MTLSRHSVALQLFTSDHKTVESAARTDGTPTALLIIMTAKEKYLKARVEWQRHCKVCLQCTDSVQNHTSTDCVLGDELVSRMDHFRLEMEDSK